MKKKQDFPSGSDSSISELTRELSKLSGFKNLY